MLPSKGVFLTHLYNLSLIKMCRMNFVQRACAFTFPLSEVPFLRLLIMRSIYVACWAIKGAIWVGAVMLRIFKTPLE